MADYSSFGREGVTNVADMNFHKAMFRDRRNPPRYDTIDTTQAPDDSNDMPRVWKSMLEGLAGAILVSVIIGLLLVSTALYKCFMA